MMVLGIALLFSTQLQAQTVSGTVSDKSSGDTLPGVNIRVQGTTNGTTTNVNGDYSLKVKSLRDTLVVSFVGFKTEVIPIQGRKNIDIALAPTVISGQQMVVIGYGSASEEEVTGSISALDSADFKKGNISSPTGMLQGEVAGLQIVNAGGGDPNASDEIQLRGLTTLTGSTEPLVVIDGIPGASMQGLDTDEIKSINVLKGGSAAAIYGTRGTNGVILIQTKEPKKGETNLDYSAKFTTETVANKLDNLSASQYRKIIKERYPNNYQSLDMGASTDWFNAITRSPLNQDHNFSIAGGAEDMSYRASLNFSTNQGIVLRNYNQQLHAKVALHQKFFDDRLNIDYRLRYNRIKRQWTDDYAMEQAFRYNPTAPVYDTLNTSVDGGYYRNPNPFQYYNPVAMIKERTDQGQEEVLNGSMKASFDILNNLEFSAEGSLDRTPYSGGAYNSHYYPIALGTNGYAEDWSNLSTERYIETKLNYDTSIGGDHNIKALAGYSFQQSEYRSMDMANQNFDTDYFKQYNIGAGYALNSGNASMSSYKESSKLISFFGRLMYNYKHKYLLTASYRYEGSTKFGKNNRWGSFPSLSVGWRINQEKFMSNIDWVNNLKLRAGYGITGNSGIGNYNALALLQTSGRMYYNGDWVNTYAPASNPNPDLKWEKKAELDIGVDYDLFGGRVSGSFDYYDRTTSDLLYNYSVPVPPNVYGSTLANVGKMTNKGFEAKLSLIPIQGNDFQWNSTILYSTNQNKLVSFSDPSKGYELSELKTGWFNTDITAWTERIVPGGPIGNFYAPVFKGYSKDGTKALYKDFNGDGKITEDDRRVVGNAFPDFRLSFKNSLKYKNWDFSFLLRGVFGQSVLNAHRMYYENFSYLGPKNILASALDHPNYEGAVDYDSRYVENASYVKLDNISLGYTFQNIANLIKSARIYISGQQLITITNYKGVDPEISISGLAPGIDYQSYYPRTKRVTFGFDIKF